MEIYNTYQEAKIANPEYAIFVYQNKFGTDKDILDNFDIQSREMKECNPADYCMTVERFLADGHKFSVCDLYISAANCVESVQDESFCEAMNKPGKYDNRLYTLRAKALEQTETPEEKEAFDVMAQDNEAAEAKAVDEWKNGDECVIRGEKLMYVGESVEEGIHCVQEFETLIYRNAHISVIEQPKPKHTKEEYVKVTDSIFDLKDDYCSGNLKFNDGTNANPEYETVIGITDLAHHLLHDNVYRKVITELTEREAFIEAACKVVPTTAEEDIKVIGKMFDAGCRFNSDNDNSMFICHGGLSSIQFNINKQDKK